MLERAPIGIFHQVREQHTHRCVEETAFRWNQREAVLDEAGDRMDVDRLPLEDQLKKIARRAPGRELRFSDVGGIQSEFFFRRFAVGSI